jgi:hypothetical protein
MSSLPKSATAQRFVNETIEELSERESGHA